MKLIALLGMIIVGLIIAAAGCYLYYKQTAKQKSIGNSLGNKVSTLGASYLISFGGILVVLGITFLIDVLK
jgi:hypothetical protein